MTEIRPTRVQLSQTPSGRANLSDDQKTAVHTPVRLLILLGGKKVTELIRRPPHLRGGGLTNDAGKPLTWPNGLPLCQCRPYRIVFEVLVRAPVATSIGGGVAAADFHRSPWRQTLHSTANRVGVHIARPHALRSTGFFDFNCVHVVISASSSNSN